MSFKTFFLCLFAMLAIGVIGSTTACNMLTGGGIYTLNGCALGLGVYKSYTDPVSGLTEDACAYDTTTNSLGESQNCCYAGSGAQNSNCRTPSSLAGVSASLYKCVPKSTTTFCPRLGLYCGNNSTCSGGNDGASICHQFNNQGGSYKLCEPY